MLKVKYEDLKIKYEELRNHSFSDSELGVIARALLVYRFAVCDVLRECTSEIHDTSDDDNLKFLFEQLDDYLHLDFSCSDLIKLFVDSDD
jgi:hypothetical protein